MPDVKSIVSSAQQLSVGERLTLIDALWATIPPTATPPLSEEWRAEIERRSAELDAGSVETVAWEKVRDGALRRNGISSGD